MLFKVRWNYNDHIYTVYSIKQEALGSDCLFLVFEKPKNIWIWIRARECEPIEE